MTQVLASQRLVLVAALSLAAVAWAGAQQVYYVTDPTDNGPIGSGNGSVNQGDLRYCWYNAQFYNSGQATTTVTIYLQCDPTLTRPLMPFVSQNTVKTINVQSDPAGPLRTISGNSLVRIFFFASPGSTLNLSTLSLAAGRAKGGDGHGGGGGGAGMGGAVFVDSGTVTSTGVTYVNNFALGGSSYIDDGRGGGGGLGGAGAPSSDGGGGGGGYWGSGGGSNLFGTEIAGGGGGGGVLFDGNASSFGYGGGGGGSTPAGTPDTRSPGAAGGTGGDRFNEFRDGLDAPLPNGGGGGGGDGDTFFAPGRGGAGNKYGGGGGTGKNDRNFDVPGGDGGMYGGGGGSVNNRGGRGGFGGGGGGGYDSGGWGGFGGGRGTNNGTQGGAGSSFGGTLFVQSGAQFTLSNGTLSEGVLLPAQFGLGNSLDPNDTGGRAAGTTAYLYDNSALAFNVSAGIPKVLGTISGTGNVYFQGPANSTVEFLGVNDYTGTTFLTAGYLRLVGIGTTGNGPIAIGDAGRLDLNGTSQTYDAGRFTFAGAGAIVNRTTGTTSTLTLDAPSARTLTGPLVEVSPGARIALVKTGGGKLTLANRSYLTGGITIQAGTLELPLADNGGAGNLGGAIVAQPGTLLSSTATNTFGYNTGTKVDSVRLNSATLLHTGPAELGWGVDYILDNGSLMASNNGVSDASANSKFSFGGFATPTTVLATGAAPSEIRGRVDLRPESGRTLVDFTVNSGAQLNISAFVTSAIGPVGLRKLGPGTLVLAAGNTYTGNTVVDAGTLILSANGNGLGTIRGGLTINPGATVSGVAIDGLGYTPGLKLDAITLNGSAVLRNDAAGSLGWGVAYTLNGGTLLSNGGVNDTTAASHWSFGGPAGQPTSVTQVAGTNGEIRGRVDLRADFGNAASNFNIGVDATLLVSAGVTGGAGILKTGDGTLKLTAANIYVGDTEMARGWVEVSSGASLGTGALRFTGGGLRYSGFNADLSGRFNQPGTTGVFAIDTNAQNVTFNTSLGGSSGLAKVGAGGLFLAVDNTFAPGSVLTMGGGTLVAQSPGALGSASLNFNGGIFRYGVASLGDISARFLFTGGGPIALDTNGFDYTAASAIGGAHGLAKYGAGILRLTGNNTYAGNTSVFGGWLEFGSANAFSIGLLYFAGGGVRYTASSTSDLSNRFDAASPGPYAVDTNGQNITFASALTGPAGLLKAGAGRLLLTASNTQSGDNTVSGGSVQVGNGGVASLGSGSGSVTLGGGTTLIFQQSNAVAQSGYITGDGGLTVNGPGTVTLTGANNYTGPTLITGGTLNIAGFFLYGRYGAGSITLTGGALRLGVNDVVGNSEIPPLVPVAAGPGTVIYNASNVFNSFNALTLNGATLQASGGFTTQYPAYGFHGTVSVTGTAPSAITATTTSALTNIVLSPATVFDVADVTGSAAVDLDVTNAFQDPVTGGAGVLRKRGAGTMRLARVSSYSGGTFVEAGTLQLGPSATLGATGAPISISGGAALDVNALGAAGFTLASGRTLTNQGAIEGVLTLASGSNYLGNGEIHGGLTVNLGATLARTSGTMRVTGTVVNNGILRFTNGALFDAGGVTSFTNNGVVDLITAATASALPVGLVNGANGLVLTPGGVSVKSASKSGSVVTVQIDGFTAHTYQLQRSSSLTGGSFVNIGAAQNGTGTTSGVTLTFTDDAAAATASFYRVLVQ